MKTAEELVAENLLVQSSDSLDLWPFIVTEYTGIGDGMREYGRRLAIEQNRLFLARFLAVGQRSVDELALQTIGPTMHADIAVLPPDFEGVQ